MLAGAVNSAGIADLLDDTLSVEAVGVFKPDARVYDLVAKRFGTDKEDVLFVSSNGWDAGCATGYGFETAWVNRAGDPVDRLPWRPAHVMRDLSGIPAVVGL
jgi:2-haloacid dehalogenase